MNDLKSKWGFADSNNQELIKNALPLDRGIELHWFLVLEAYNNVVINNCIVCFVVGCSSLLCLFGCF